MRPWSHRPTLRALIVAAVALGATACKTSKESSFDLEDCQDYLAENHLEGCYYCFNKHVEGATAGGTGGGVAVAGFSAGVLSMVYDAGDTDTTTIKQVPGDVCDACTVDHFDDLLAGVCEAAATQGYAQCECGLRLDACDPADGAGYVPCLVEAMGYDECDSMACTIEQLVNLADGMSVADAQAAYEVCEGPEVDLCDDASRTAVSLEPDAPEPPPPGYAGPTLQALARPGHHYRVTQHTQAFELLFAQSAGRGTLWTVTDEVGAPLRVQLGYLPAASDLRVLGFESRDVILRAGGHPITQADQLIGLLSQAAPGSVMPVRIQRGEVVRVHWYHLD